MNLEMLPLGALRGGEADCPRSCWQYVLQGVLWVRGLLLLWEGLPRLTSHLYRTDGPGTPVPLFVYREEKASCAEFAGGSLLGFCIFSFTSHCY